MDRPVNVEITVPVAYAGTPVVRLTTAIAKTLKEQAPKPPA